MKKIMFNDRYGLTEAVLEGRKTMTRRIIKAPKTMEGQWVSGFAICKRPGSDEVVEVMALDADEGMINNIMPKYKPGEVVAQKYCEIEIPISGETRIYNEGLDLYQSKLEYEPGWANKMFVRADLMPHQIRITNVRVERMQDISSEDCLREGVLKNGGWRPYNFALRGFSEWFETPQKAFAALIDKLSGKGTWDKNPWVWVYDFQLVR